MTKNQDRRSRKSDGRRRVVIEGVSPEIDCGRYPVKRIAGDVVEVQADVFTDGHDLVRAVLLHRRGDSSDWFESPMTPLGNDRWRAEFRVERPGPYRYTIEAWVDPFASWRDAMSKKIRAGEDADVDYLVGARMVERAAGRAAGGDAELLAERAGRLASPGADPDMRRTCALDKDLAGLMLRWEGKEFVSRYDRELELTVDRERARFGAWYELFPRSYASEPGRHGTFKDCERHLSYVASMNFDVVYFPPVHPIGKTRRKGKNNEPRGGPDDVGSPWGIGSDEGGHKSVHPRLGNLEDFRSLVAKARSYGMEVALDVALQCSPDHPDLENHPEWFLLRPDGTVQYAENPPKKYQDIYPYYFECERWEELWEEMKSVFLFWADHGVRIFRVDNPHTKPFRFWRWLIAEIKEAHPETIFLAEAFTRPKVMYELAKSGFSQSYTYFAWRNTKEELTRYFTDLTRTGIREYYRPNLWPNTPDILTEYLQYGGRSAFIVRLILAATLGASYGIYGAAFELCENRSLGPGSEEYLDSEKYEVRRWNLDDPASLKDLIARVNLIRRQNPALQRDWNLRFHAVDNEEILCYSKFDELSQNFVLIAVNLDPHHTQSGWIDLTHEALDVEDIRPYQVEDLLSGTRFLWQGARNYIELDPQTVPARIFSIRRRLRTERDFDYYM